LVSDEPILDVAAVVGSVANSRTFVAELASIEAQLPEVPQRTILAHLAVLEERGLLRRVSATEFKLSIPTNSKPEEVYRYDRLRP
jgi:hypothetical protein